MIVLGIGLLVLWLVGLQAGADWLIWLDFVAGCLSILGGLALGRERGVGRRVAEPFLLSSALFVLWIVALAEALPPWETWWTFAFACAYVILGLAGSTAVSRRATTSTPRTA